jgi:hypothetical protein
MLLPLLAVNPELKTGPFTLSEDEALEEAVAELGTHWIEVRRMAGEVEQR